MTETDFRVRSVTAADIPALAGIEAACFSEPWSAWALTETLDCAYAHLICIETGSVLAAYGGLYLLGDSADITNIAVLPAYRRRGFGAAVLSALAAYAYERGAQTVHLEVRASNAAAIALYTRFGFVCDGIRRHYYKNPAEDAHLMTYTFQA